MSEKTPVPPLVELLGMDAHVEGGWYVQTWRTGRRVGYEPDGYSGPRGAASAIYYYLETGQHSRWHRVRSDEAWLWHRGGPLRLSVAPPGPGPDLSQVTAIDLGPGIEEGQRPQYVVPADHWQAAYPLGDDGTLTTCVVAPGFHYDDFTMLEPDADRQVHAEAHAVVPADPAQVWPHIAQFDDIARWHPLLSDSQHAGGLADPCRPGHLRTITTIGGEKITERVVELTSAPGTCTYEFLSAPYQVSIYTATIEITAGPNPGTSLVTWSAQFTPVDPADADQLRDLFTHDVFGAGLTGLAEKVAGEKGTRP